MTGQLPLGGTCSTCNGVLLWANGRLVCPRPHCPGHNPGNAAR